MKLNKWTLGLAAVGVVGLASAVEAQEAATANTVLTGLSSTTLSGYVDTSAQWNFGTGNENSPPYAFGGANKADGFNLDVVQLSLDKPMDESQWAAGYHVDLWLGPDANALGSQSTGVGADFAIRQAYVALRTPIGNGIDWKLGVFDTIIGYESLSSPNNPNYTHSYGFSIEPTTHTGLLGTYRINDNVSIAGGIANTVGPVINSRAFYPVQQNNAYAESYKTYMGSLAITAPDNMGFLAGSTLYGGVVNGFNNSFVGSGYAAPSLNAYVGGTFATPVTGLRTGLAWDFVRVNSYSSTQAGVLAGKNKADIWSLAAYLSYQATEKLSLHGRFEYVSGDIDQGFNTFAPLVYGRNNGIFATTLTAQYDLWKNVLSRVEFRWDHLEHGHVFGFNSNTSSGGRANAFMLAANVIYKF